MTDGKADKQFIRLYTARPTYPWLSNALLLCFGVNAHVSGAGPRNISEMRTQSRLSPLASSVSEKCTRGQ